MNYFLFSDDIYDSIKMDYRKSQMNKFFDLWNEGHSALYIASKMKISEIEVYLLITDLHITGKLPARNKDYYGRDLKWTKLECNQN